MKNSKRRYTKRQREYNKKYHQDHPFTEEQKTARAIYYGQWKQTLAGRYSMLCSSAKYKKIRNLLSFEQYAEIIQFGTCHYCGRSLQNSGWGLDRINSALGYEIGNVYPCCTTCNLAKNDMTEVEFKQWIQAVAQNWAFE